MQPAAADVAVVILAGGEATRFPGKLQSDAGGVPLLLRVYRNVRSIGPVYVSANAPLGEATARELDCTIVPDREPGRGPLGGIVSTFESVREPLCFTVAGDAPFVGRGVFERLLAVWEPHLEAVAAERSGRLEPLCAIYSREAFLREGRSELATGSGAVRAVVERLAHRRVGFPDERALAGINTVAERDALLGFHL
ncbi:MAG TPA: molybdenum cofactor guanylyltransferase [Candidatus Rubrimentiphilum sp.]|nr:molybdenum cofactor guanylyltransferase [Candidatus Rubrimentiphilum sp.]